MQQEMKTFNVRIPKDMWVLLKHESIRKELSMNAIITECLNKYKKKLEKKENKLTDE
jgi:predicted HicB family RNase H-like nuclease